MTPREMQIAFMTDLENAGTTFAGFSDDLFRLLNEAQDIIVEEAFARTEQDVEALDRLRELLTKDSELDTLWAGTEADYLEYSADKVTLPSDYLHLISHRSLINHRPSGISFSLVANKRVADNTLTSKVVLNRFGQADDIYRLLWDPFNTTTHKSPIADVNEDTITVYTDASFVVDKVYLNYVREPLRISLTPVQACELPDYVHRTVIDVATRLYLERNRALNNQSQG